MKQYFIFFILLFIHQSTVYSQKPNYEAKLDIDKDGTVEEVLFYDLNEEEFEKTQFTKITIVKGTDSISFINDDVWVTKRDLYKKSDKQVVNRIGILFENNTVFLWLTGFQYGCCLNATSILEYTGDSIKEVFNKEFEIEDVRMIDEKRYLIGRQWLGEVYGGFGVEEAPYYFMSFVPKEFRLLGDGMQVDSILTQEMNLVAPIVEDSLDVYNATIVHVKYFSKDFLISTELESSLNEKSYGILSLVKVTVDYLNQFTNEELRIARNEIFAFKGYKFKSNYLNEYFDKERWYEPVSTNSDSIYQSLSEIEKFNINLIRAKEIRVGNNK